MPRCFDLAAEVHAGDLRKEAPVPYVRVGKIRQLISYLMEVKPGANS